MGKATKIVTVLFTLIGVAMLIGGVFMFNRTRRFTQRSVATTGTVVELLLESRSSTSAGRRTVGHSYYPLIRFKTKSGQVVEFKSSFGSNPPSYVVGARVPILYDPDNPHRAEINSFMSLWMGVIILLALGGIFTAVGVGTVLVAVASKRKIEWLKTAGEKIATDFQRVELDTSVKVRGRSPYRIISQWHDPTTNKVYVFESENIWFNPEEYIKGDKIDVYVDINNPKNYYMDISFLPKSVE